MAQFLRPNSDVSTGTWTTAPLFEKVDETSFSDADFITSPNNSNTTCDLGLSTAPTPQSGTRTLRIRARKGAAAGNTRGLNYNLKQGGVSVQSGTVNAALSETYTTYSITITGTITDYTNLSLELTSTGTTGGSGGNRRTVEVSWVEFEVPNAVPTYNLSGATTGKLGTGSGNATNVAPNNDRNLSGSVNGLLGSATGTSTNVAPQFNLSGSVNGLLGQTTGNAEVIVPTFDLNGSASAILGQATGNATNVEPQFNLSGSTNGLLGYGSGSAEVTTPQFNLSGSTNALLGQATGNVTNGEPQFNLSGSATGLLGTTIGNAEITVPTFDLNGSATGLLGQTIGNAETTVPTFDLNGSTNGLLATTSGNVSNGEPIFDLNGSITGLLGTTSGNAETTVPTFDLNGSTNGLIGQAVGEVANGAVVFNLSGGVVSLSVSAFGELTSVVPNFNITGIVSGLVGNAEGIVFTIDAGNRNISGSMSAPMGSTNGFIFTETYDLNGMPIYRYPTDLPTISFPLGLDIVIKTLQNDLAQLVWLRYSFGRAYIGEKEQVKGKDYRYPMVYKGGGDYQDASPNDNLISQSFILVDDDYSYDEYDINEENKYVVPLSLVIWGDLKKLSPLVDEHFGEVLLQDALRVIRNNGDVKIKSITDNAVQVFREFTISQEPTSLFYYPFFCYRIEMEAAVSESCITDIQQALTDYNIT